MFSIHLSCNVRAARNTAESMASYLQAEFMEHFGLSSTAAIVKGTGGSDQGAAINIWFLAQTDKEYDPTNAVRVAEKMADDIRLAARGRAKGGCIGFWDATRAQKLDEYFF